MTEVQVVGSAMAALGACFVVYLRHRRELSLGLASLSLLVIALFEYSIFSYGLLGAVFLGRFSPLTSILVSSVTVLFFAVLIVNAKSVRASAQLRRLIRQQAIDAFDPPNPGQTGAAAGPLVAVVIPAVNEAGTLGGVLEGLAVHREYQLVPVVVDDGSADGTLEVARGSNIVAVRHHLTVGYGGALKTGYAVAQKLGAEIIVQMDADGESDPSQLGTLVEAVLKDEGSLVVGSRFLGGAFRSTRARRFGIGFFTWLTNRLTGFKLTDVTSGYRAFSASRTDSVSFESDMHCAIEMILRAKKNGLTVEEVPIAYEWNAQRHSKLFSKKRMLRFPFVMLGQILSFYL